MGTRLKSQGTFDPRIYNSNFVEKTTAKVQEFHRSFENAGGGTIIPSTLVGLEL